MDTLNETINRLLRRTSTMNLGRGHELDPRLIRTREDQDGVPKVVQEIQFWHLSSREQGRTRIRLFDGRMMGLTTNQWWVVSNLARSFKCEPSTVIEFFAAIEAGRSEKSGHPPIKFINEGVVNER